MGGDGEEEEAFDEQRTPKQVEALRGEHVVAVAAGAVHTLCVLRGGRVLGWGKGEGADARLGLRLRDNQTTPLAYEHRAPAGTR